MSEHNHAVPLREYIEKVIADQDAATQRAIEKADVEREKAAATLRENLSFQIQSGDAALRDHITNQVSQVRGIIESQDRQQDKFESQVKQQFAQVNEFRGSLDDLGKTMATRREMEDMKVTLASSLEDLSKQTQELRSRLDVGPSGLSTLQTNFAASQGRSQGVNASVGMLFAAMGAMAAVISIVIVLSNVLTGK